MNAAAALSVALLMDITSVLGMTKISNCVIFFSAYVEENVFHVALSLTTCILIDMAPRDFWIHGYVRIYIFFSNLHVKFYA